MRCDRCGAPDALEDTEMVPDAETGYVGTAARCGGCRRQDAMAPRAYPLTEPRTRLAGQRVRWSPR